MKVKSLVTDESVTAGKVYDVLEFFKGNSEDEPLVEVMSDDKEDGMTPRRVYLRQYDEGSEYEVVEE